MSDDNTEAVTAASRLLRPLIQRVRRDVCWVMRAGGNGPRSTDEPLTKAKIAKHLNGGPYFGAAQILPGESTTRVAILDLDSHKGETPWLTMVETAAMICTALNERGLAPVVFRSTGGRGIHIYMLWDAAQDAYSVRMRLRDALTAVGLAPGTAGVAQGEVEVFPKQDHVPEGKYGNMAILPLAGQSALLEPMLDYEPVEPPEDFDWPMSEPVPVVERPEREAIAVEPSVELAQFREALAAIPNSAEQELSYDEWRNIIFSIHHATGGSDEGLALAHEFSARAGKYDAEFLDNRVWPYIDGAREGGITDRYVISAAREYGWSDVSIDDFDIVPTPEDDFEALDPVPEADTTKKTNRFPVRSIAEFTSAPPPQWFIKGVLPEAELMVVYGASTAGKSFMALDMAAALDRGVEWRGKRTRRARVVYVCAEGVGGFRQRIKAYQRQHDCELNMGIVEVAPNFLLKEDVVELARAVIEWGRADLIILDTWAQVLPGANENSGEDIGKALGHCAGLRRATGASVMLIHHSGKDETRGARGWSGLKAAADAEIEVLRNGEERAMQITKMKDGSDGESFGFRLLPVTIGLDEDGDEITSCVVEASDTSASAILNARRKTHRPGSISATVMAYISDQLIDVGGGLDSEVLTREIAETLPEPEGPRDTRRQQVKRTITKLIESGELVQRGVFVFLPETAD